MRKGRSEEGRRTNKVEVGVGDEEQNGGSNHRYAFLQSPKTDKVAGGSNRVGGKRQTRAGAREEEQTGEEEATTVMPSFNILK
ncbi:hypothetical protein L6452_08978 [Arctium lappa]|uniref:Uncharacterized protein n=1 Tax=Arctium lappa TaxID=4217 RepID=A0ACB9DIQ4_ARCLA|nr:hypothetical protein L6452_08978 [Arctium lappa]